MLKEMSEIIAINKKYGDVMKEKIKNLQTITDKCESILMKMAMSISEMDMRCREFPPDKDVFCKNEVKVQIKNINSEFREISKSNYELRMIIKEALFSTHDPEFIKQNVDIFNPRMINVVIAYRNNKLETVREEIRLREGSTIKEIIHKLPVRKDEWCGWLQINNDPKKQVREDTVLQDGDIITAILFHDCPCTLTNKNKENCT